VTARIRDFFETKDGWIFAVADYSHPEGIRSLLRYVPDPVGEREAGGIRYRKLDFDPSFEFLKKARPSYVKDLHVVPEEDVVRFFRPSVGLKSVAAKDSRVNRIAMLLADAGVPWEEMGITGSMLIGLHGPSSDIDFVVYGPWWWKARDILTHAKAQGRIEELDDATWRKIYSKRKPETSFEEFVLHEKRKGQGHDRRNLLTCSSPAIGTRSRQTCRKACWKAQNCGGGGRDILLRQPGDISAEAR
jgi:predicted nucleotidyltransferase